jgi:hypothetical protein
MPKKVKSTPITVADAIKCLQEKCKSSELGVIISRNGSLMVRDGLRDYFVTPSEAQAMIEARISGE